MILEQDKIHILVAIFVALQVGAAVAGPSCTRSAPAKAISDSKQPAPDNCRRASSRAAKSGNGQLESFSSESTGLGDLEAAEPLKKMEKRSKLLRKPATTPTPATTTTNERQQSQQKNKRAGQLRLDFNQLAGRFRRLQPAAIVGPASGRGRLYALQPILITRRTDDNGLPLDDSTGGRPDESGASAESELPGEFDSRFSLLTMRKTPLDEAYEEAWPTAEEPTEPVSSRIFISPKGLRQSRLLPAADQQQLDSDVSFVNGNYLPRVARALM